LTGVQKASSAATKPQGLVAAIQKAAGLKPMKPQLTAEEMQAMMQEVTEKGDPHRGEEVYRRAQLQCTVCHAIGGVGGVIGPDMVSIGASAPVDYLVESLLEPSKKIKEGYHTTLVTTKKGDAFSGALASETGAEMVIRDAAGQEHRIAKADIAETVISPVSLMPPGLTMSLREDEFVDLVRFLSELGKEGEFKTAPNRFVRHWQALQPHPSTRDSIGHYGSKIFIDPEIDYQWTPAYADVSGGLPTKELPQVVGRGRNRMGVARFVIQAGTAGSIGLKLPKTKDVDLFVGDKEIRLEDNAGETVVPVKIAAGKTTVTLVGLLGWGLDEFRVELVDTPGGDAKAQVTLPPVAEW
jgi:putative heme-binding domain-containing protein